jgi:hypothetical protein
LQILATGDCRPCSSLPRQVPARLRQGTYKSEWRCDADARLDLEVDAARCRDALHALIPCITARN